MGYIIYCTVTSSGTSNIEEVTRIVSEHYLASKASSSLDNFNECFQIPKSHLPTKMDNVPVVPERIRDFLPEEFNLHKDLCFIAATHMFYKNGNSKYRRQNTAYNGERFNIKYGGEKVFTLVTNVQKRLEKSGLTHGLKYDRIMQKLHDDLMQIPFINFQSSLEIIQMSALLGLLPLVCCEFSTLMGKGYLQMGCTKFITTGIVPSSKKIAQKMDADNHMVQNVFDTIVTEANKILPKLKISKAVAHNVGNEVWRIFIQFLNDTNMITEFSKNMSKQRTHDLFRKCFDQKDKNLFDKHCGTFDTIYIDWFTCRNRPVQPCFRVLTSTSRPVLQMCTHIINEDEGTHDLESIKLTGWFNYERKDSRRGGNLLKSMKMKKELIKWEGTDLKIDQDVERFFLPVRCFKSENVQTCCPACTTSKMVFRKRTRGYKYESIQTSSDEIYENTKKRDHVPTIDHTKSNKKHKLQK